MIKFKNNNPLSASTDHPVKIITCYLILPILAALYAHPTLAATTSYDGFSCTWYPVEGYLQYCAHRPGAALKKACFGVRANHEAHSKYNQGYIMFNKGWAAWGDCHKMHGYFTRKQFGGYIRGYCWIKDLVIKKGYHGRKIWECSARREPGPYNPVDPDDAGNRPK